MSLQPDFSPAGELLYILYQSTGNHVAGTNLLVKVHDYNPVCYYAFYYLGLEQVANQQYDHAVDSMQNAIRLYQSEKAKTSLLKCDYPELTRQALGKVFAKLPDKRPSAVGDLHPARSGTIMWVHLCHCYMQQANYVAAFNCISKSVDDYLQYIGPIPDSKAEQQPIPVGDEFAALVSGLTELNASGQHHTLVKTYATLCSHTAGWLAKPAESVAALADILNLMWNSSKCAMHLSLFKESLVFSELGVKAAVGLYRAEGKELHLKYAESLLTNVMQCGYYLIDDARKSELKSLAAYTEKYVRVFPSACHFTDR